ncbi:hypothetical protein NC653_027013 [Populus alba x Populus x berolinensis]|uniref:Uncharacterized protein n=1 Tax=Populus alba x Populus x berolinensis TaxID=444605 RepID=A0AAD6M4E3_9ROSI|nr:hypothetical protein NC653_027013 [Populus alba x Populus x berolinensis]
MDNRTTLLDTIIIVQSSVRENILLKEDEEYSEAFCPVKVQTWFTILMYSIVQMMMALIDSSRSKAKEVYEQEEERT